MRRICILLALLAATPLRAQSAADSALVGRILLAEDRRDSSDAALAAGMRSGDARIQLIARRALGRIRDPRFGARDSLPAPAPAPVWPEPAWRVRFRALAGHGASCDSMAAALADSAWQVRLHAADLVAAGCGGDARIRGVLTRWVDGLPPGVTRRPRGGVSWHAGAHALTALARVAPAEARRRLPPLARHPDWHVRMYAARAAGVLADTARLRDLAADANGNVVEAAIDALSHLRAHAADDVYLRALEGGDAQAVRAAAVALKGSPRGDAAAAALRVFQRWVARANDSERDVRVALLDVAGRPASDDRPPAPRYELPPQAVALALGQAVQLRVTMAEVSGGGSFVVRLRGDLAPLMSARVLALAKAGYYDGGNWHRVEPDFVIQGGGPGSNEYVGYAHYLRDELANLPHPRGSVGMSTRAHDTGDAQWFINLKDNPRLVRDYTVFGEVVEGIEVVDGILEGDRVASMRVENRVR